MIQRIQTVFLLLSIIVLGLFLWFPLIAVESPNFNDVVQGWGVGVSWVFNDQPYIYLINSILTGTAIGISLLNIFLYKKRGLQMLLCWFAIILIASAEGFVFFKYQTKVFVGDVILTPWNLLAAAAVVLQVLAFFFIRKDEDLVRSLDRLR